MNFIIISLLCVLAGEMQVFGYIDPGTGSYVFQILIASLLAVSFVIRRFWDNIRAWFSGLRKKDSDKKPDTE